MVCGMRSVLTVGCLDIFSFVSTLRSSRLNCHVDGTVPMEDEWSGTVRYDLGWSFEYMLVRRTQV